MNIQRVLAVLAAVLTVCAVALGTIEVHPRELGQILSDFDTGLPERLHSMLDLWCGQWAWNDLALPLLQRPAWLPPAAMALLVTGAALTMPGRTKTKRSRRRS